MTMTIEACRYCGNPLEVGGRHAFQPGLPTVHQLLDANHVMCAGNCGWPIDVERDSYDGIECAGKCGRYFCMECCDLYTFCSEPCRSVKQEGKPSRGAE